MAADFKIKAPNFTAIPNVIFDHWMKILSHLQFKVLICICRKTLGWHKDRDMISLSQIAEMTNSSRDGVRECLKVLEAHELIRKTSTKNSFGDHNPNTYELNIIDDIGKTESIAQVGDSFVHQKGQEVGDSFVHVGDSSHPQKKLIKIKENKLTNPLPLSKGEPEFLNFGTHVKLKKESYETFCNTHSKEFIDEVIQEIEDHLLSTGKKSYKDYAATIRNWIRRKETLFPSRAGFGMKAVHPAAPVDPEKKKLQELAEEMIREQQRGKRESS